MTDTMETQETSATTVTVTMRGKDLGRVLHNVSLAVSKDDYRPVLRCLHVTIAGGKFTAEATDSYMLIEDSAPLTDDPEGLAHRPYSQDSSWSGLIMADQLADLRKRLLTRETYPREVSISFADDGPNGSITFNHDGTRCTFPKYVGEFPNTAAIWPADDADSALDGGRIAVTSTPLVKLAKVLGPDGTKGNALTFAFRSKDKAFTVTETAHGSSLRALVMPYRS